MPVEALSDRWDREKPGCRVSHAMWSTRLGGAPRTMHPELDRKAGAKWVGDGTLRLVAEHA